MVPEARVMMIVGSVMSTHSHCCRCWRAGCADCGCDPSDQNTLAVTDRAKVSAAGRRGYGVRRWCDGFPLVKRGRPIHAHRLSRVPQALLKHSRRVISRHIPLAPHDVIYMLAHCGRIYRGLASAEAELISRHKILGAQSKKSIRTLWRSVRAIGKLPSTREFPPTRRMR